MNLGGVPLLVQQATFMRSNKDAISHREIWMVDLATHGSSAENDNNVKEPIFMCILWTLVSKSGIAPVPGGGNRLQDTLASNSLRTNMGAKAYSLESILSVQSRVLIQ